MKRQLVEPHPPRRPNAKPALWLGWALSAAGLLALSTALMSEAISIQENRRFTGVFEPSTRQQALVLPADTPLSAVLVSEGEDVIQGQRIALFDQVMLSSQASHLQSGILVNELERGCLMRRPNQPALSDDAVAPRLEIAAALDRCRLHHRENSLSKEQLHHEYHSFAALVQLRDREAKERLKLAQPGVQHLLSLRAALLLPQTAARELPV